MIVVPEGAAFRVPLGWVRESEAEEHWVRHRFLPVRARLVYSKESDGLSQVEFETSLENLVTAHQLKWGAKTRH